MTDTFNPAEIAEDKDLTIAQLRAERNQLRLDCQELQMEATDARDRLAEYARTSLLKLNQAKSNLANTMQLLQEARSQAPSVDQIISKYVADLVSSILESNDIRNLIEQAIDQQVERVLANPDFVHDHVKEAVQDCLSNAEIDAESQVERAIEEALDNVRISFRS